MDIGLLLLIHPGIICIAYVSVPLGRTLDYPVSASLLRKPFVPMTAAQDLTRCLSESRFLQ